MKISTPSGDPESEKRARDSLLGGLAWFLGPGAIRLAVALYPLLCLGLYLFFSRQMPEEWASHGTSHWILRILLSAALLLPCLWVNGLLLYMVFLGARAELRKTKEAFRAGLEGRSPDPGKANADLGDVRDRVEEGPARAERDAEEPSEE